MAPLPKPFSLSASAIEAAISEGRAEEAMQKLLAALRADRDDRAIRYLAAEWIERIALPPGSAKALRNGGSELPDEWLDISEMVGKLQSDGNTYEAAVRETAEHFRYSERHVQRCVADWNAAKEASRDYE
ncbi:hypothetical protein GOB10_25680 [Sinorhizobium meliloti]|nr:hypothetical protein [Sinorhizobium meliloti]